MFEQHIQEAILLMVYAGVAVISLIACIYLLFRRGNAFAPNSDDTWYSLDGRKLDGKPMQKGVYIYKGKKCVVK